MKLRIRNLGPLKNVELELGDITVLLGPPNSGKSYALKSLYSRLMVLDSVARDFILKKAADNLSARGRIGGVSKAVSLETLAGAAVLHEDLPPKDAEKLIKALENKLKAKRIEISSEDAITVISLRNEVIMSINDLLDAIEDRYNFAVGRFLPLAKDTEISICVSSMLFSKLSKMSGIESGIFDEVKKLADSDEIKTELHGFIRDGATYIVKADLQPIEEGKMILSTLLKIHLDRNSAYWEFLEKRIKRLLEGARKELNKANVTVPLDKLLNTLLRRNIFLSPTFKYREVKIYRSLLVLMNKLMRIIGDHIKYVYETALNIQYALFIPFGRSPFVYQLDEISAEPFRLEALVDIYKSNLHFYSYIRHLSLGRSNFIGEQFDGELIKLFIPVLQGKLSSNGLTRRLRYWRWNSPDIPISLASALAGEVAGLLLPLLAVPRNSYLIIEEPEAQLHYSAQILMGLTIAALSKKFGHRIALSTHSDILALTLAYLKKLQYDEESVLGLIRRLLELQGVEAEEDDIRPLAQAVLQSNDLDIRFYYFKVRPDGSTEVSEVPLEDILKEVPSITETTDILASWVLKSRR